MDKDGPLDGRKRTKIIKTAKRSSNTKKIFKKKFYSAFDNFSGVCV